MTMEIRQTEIYRKRESERARERVRVENDERVIYIYSPDLNGKKQRFNLGRTSIGTQF